MTHHYDGNPGMVHQIDLRKMLQKTAHCYLEDLRLNHLGKTAKGMCI